ncbi:hypothetical protein AAY473_005252 [Plecturocebus cupreus]
MVGSCSVTQAGVRRVITAHYRLKALGSSRSSHLSLLSSWDNKHTPPPPAYLGISLPGDSRQRSHTGRQGDSFGRCGCFAGAPAQRFPVRSIPDRQARLVPSPQGKQQLEALRTESFTASTANPERSGSVGKGRPPKEN